jgi:hypothetical protein
VAELIGADTDSERAISVADRCSRCCAVTCSPSP